MKIKNKEIKTKQYKQSLFREGTTQDKVDIAY